MTTPVMTAPLCTVVIPTCNRPDLLKETLASLCAQLELNFDVIVVSDGEDAALRSLAQSFQPPFSISWLFHAQNRGQAAARNTGAAAATGEILLFLDDDTPAAPDLIARHLARHHSVDPHRRLAVVGNVVELRREPLIKPTDKFLQEFRKRDLEIYANLTGATGPDSIGPAVETTLAFGLNCSIRRTVFLAGGGFREALRVTDEDSELGLRLYLAGVEAVYEPDAVVFHNGTKDLAAYLKRCWSASGSQDLYRVFDLGEKSAQTRRLVEPHYGYILDRLISHFSWRASSPLLAVAGLLERAANRTAARPFVAAWSRTAQPAAYWSAVKATGYTLHQLKSVAGAPRCALMLHSVASPQSQEEASYYIAPQRFRRLMQRFHSSGYKTATIAQWLTGDLPRKHLLLTFDDGYDDLYEHLLPLVLQHSYTPVIYLVADRIGASNIWDQASGLRARNLLTLAQIREMQKYGVEFGSHTLTHPSLPTLSDRDLHREIHDSKTKLEDLLGVEISSFAYPYGAVDRRVRAAVAAAGYKVAFTTRPGTNFWNDPLCQNRADINNHTSARDFTTALRTGYGFTQSLSMRLQHFEQQLPTRALRSAARNLRGLGHHARVLISRQK